MTGERTRKGATSRADRAARSPSRCRESDLVLEGDAEQVTDPPTVAAMSERSAAGGWPCRVDVTGRALTAEYERPLSRPAAVVRLPHHPAGRGYALSTIEPGGAPCDS